MNTGTPSHLLLRWERNAGLVAIAAVLVAGALSFSAPRDALHAYGFAIFAWFGPAIGSLLMSLIYRTTGGQWGTPLIPFFDAGVRLLPWIWFLVLPLLFNSSWAAHPPAMGGTRTLYLSRDFVVGRTFLYGVIFLLLRLAVTRSSPLRPNPSDYPWLGPVGLIVSVFTIHLLSVDWIFSLDPEWRSTGFPLVWITGQAVSGLAPAVGFAVLAGTDPSARGVAERPVGVDWGNLLLATILIWTYVGFLQFLIIWSGNLPNEISWYVHRRSPGWLAVVTFLLLFHFALPFFLLLSRRLKRSVRGLVGVTALLLSCQLLYTAWLFLPNLPSYGWATWALRLATLAAVGGFFLNRYLGFARQRSLAP